MLNKLIQVADDFLVCPETIEGEYSYKDDTLPAYMGIGNFVITPEMLEELFDGNDEAVTETYFDTDHYVEQLKLIKRFLLWPHNIYWWKVTEDLLLLGTGMQPGLYSTRVVDMDRIKAGSIVYCAILTEDRK